MFEFLVAEILLREQVIPFYFQARLNHVPNAEFDFVCFDPTRPVVLSCKVSLRERYKQADLEGMALKQVYRLAESHLITLSKEATGVKKKIKNGDVVGLTSCIRADQAEFDDFVERLVK